METAELHDLRYPIGQFIVPELYTRELLDSFITEIEEVPANLRTALEGLDEIQLNTRYRPEGWTVKQVANHIADSHINAYIRYKLALTEDHPQSKGFANLWAELQDVHLTPVSVSINLLESLHKRWVILLKTLTDEQFDREYIHPSKGLVDLKWTTALYAWHGKHHIAHITSLRKRNGW